MILAVKNFIPILVIFGQALVIFLIFIWIFKNKFPKLASFIGKNGMALGMSFSGLSLCGSLFYSEVLGYNPCTFCWWQRIFMYPLLVIFIIASIYKDKNITKYILPLSILGALLSLNHYILQLSGTSLIPCSALGQSASCSKVFVLSYGYITIPLMAFTAFLGIIVSMLLLRNERKNEVI